MDGKTHPRPRRALSGNRLHFSIAEQVAKLHAEPEWRAANHNAITLLKDPSLGLILMALGREARLDEHRAPATIAIHVLSGRVDVRIGEDRVLLEGGDIVTMEQATPHEVVAIEESVVLLTIGGRKAP